MDEPTFWGAPSHVLAIRPRLLSRAIIFTNGPSLTLKTTLSGVLSRSIGIPVRGTHEFGTVLTNGGLDLGKRLGRYPPLFANARDVLAVGDSIILDGNFGDRERRLGVYRLAHDFNLRVIAIRTDCDDLDLIRERARWRAANPTSPDRDVDDRFSAITRSEVLAHPIEHDPEFRKLAVEIIEFHTGCRPRVVCHTHAGTDARLIAGVLQAIRLLPTDRFGAPRAGVLLAGIG